ncbi:MAG: RluA family pseudouridine synthase [Sphingomonadaceae bacterium]
MSESETLCGILAVASDSGPARLDKALADVSSLSRERIKSLLKEGAITLDGKIVTSPSVKVHSGARFTIRIPAVREPAARPQDIALDIVYEDADLIVLNKPAGIVVHPAAGNADGTLVNALLHHCKGELSGIGGVARPGIVHRIDKDTSGLLVIAKNDQAHEGLAHQFADHSIERSYLAVCAGHPIPSEGVIRTRIGRSDKNRKKMAVLPEDSKRGKHAVTHYNILDKLDNSSLIQCRLETGRTHQIRVHMASIGHALLGDPTYGRTPFRIRPVLREIGFARQALHAATLGFIHPVRKERCSFSAPMPEDMAGLIARLDQSDRLISLPK